MIGYMKMPPGFRYREAALKGRPLHPDNDIFRIRHPYMPLDRRAKLFSSFDALSGFKDAIADAESRHCGRA